MDTETKHQYLMEAFNDGDFQNDLQTACDCIAKKMFSFAKDIGRICYRIDNVFSLESRVKTSDSFEEKLYRKNYINEWDVKVDKVSNQDLIKRELTDIIGVRINCYFAQYEDLLFSEFEKAKAEFAKDGYELNFEENKIQKNGHEIYKFSGKYKDTYHFEVQIKSVIHNVWGETEHKTVYKNLSYDGYISEKKTITNSLFNILRASEEQLYSLFRMEESEEHLIRSLFFCQTKEQIADKCKTKILAFHYENYFRSFQNIGEIKEYVINSLQGIEYKPTIVAERIKGNRDDLIEVVKEKFPVFYLECIYNIDCVIHTHESFDRFLSFFLETVLPEEEKDDFDKDFEQDFGVEDTNPQNNLKSDYIQKINVVLGDCMIVKK